MPSISFRAALVALVASGAAVSASAQESGVQPGLKLRTGYGFTDPDRLSNTQFAFSAVVGFLVGQGRIDVELGYQWKSGTEYLAPLQPPAAGKPVADSNFSMDTRRNSMNGVFLRAGYGFPVLPDLYLQGGLQAGGARYRQDYLADVADTNWSTYEDVYNGNPTKSVIAVSPFVGVRYNASSDSAFELNLLDQRYTAINFTHTPGSAPTAPISSTVANPNTSYVGDALVQNARSVIHVELAYTFRF